MDSLVVEPMRMDLLLWRCLHGGPLDAASIDAPPPTPQVDWERARARNLPLLNRLTTTYGACAIVARDGAKVVATLRFYPRALCAFGEGGEGFCLQHEPPAGPAVGLGTRELPSLQELADRTLFVHCLMIVSERDQPDRRRRGLGTRMAQELIRWAEERGWGAIEANAYEDIPILYAISGVAGRSFWKKLGFRVVLEEVEVGIAGELLDRVRREADAAGIPTTRATTRSRMRLELHPPPAHLTGG
jgi:GNAT superfamily N-acetyltransferase